MLYMSIYCLLFEFDYLLKQSGSEPHPLLNETEEAKGKEEGRQQKISLIMRELMSAVPSI